MTLWQWALIALAAVALCLTGLAAAFALITRRARRLADRAGEVCILCDRLIDDPRVLPHHRLILRALRVYLHLPLDLIPDFIPLVGRLGDRLITALAIQVALRHANAELMGQHWPGPRPAPRRLLRRARGRARPDIPRASAPA